MTDPCQARAWLGARASRADAGCGCTFGKDTFQVGVVDHIVFGQSVFGQSFSGRPVLGSPIVLLVAAGFEMTGAEITRGIKSVIDQPASDARVAPEFWPVDAGAIHERAIGTPPRINRSRIKPRRTWRRVELQLLHGLRAPCLERSFGRGERLGHARMYSSVVARGYGAAFLL